MELALVNPNFAGIVTIPSFGLGYIATHVRKNSDWNVKVVESIQHDITEVQALDRVRDSDVVGLVCYTESRFQTFNFAEKVKSINPDAKIIIGGPHATALDEAILQHYPIVDAVVRHEGEETVLDIVRGKPWEQIQGLTRRTPGGVVRNPNRPLLKCIDALEYDYDLAFPRWKDWKDTEVSQELQQLRHIPLISSRGCPFKCSFCGANSQWLNSYRRTSPEVLIAEVKRLIARYGAQYFRFYDALFIGNDANILEFCDRLEAEGINIRFRIDIRIGTSPYVLERLRRVGCEVLGFGVETGSDAILKRTNKGITRQQVIETVRAGRTLGFYMIGFFMVAHPDETTDDIRQTFELFKDLDFFNLQFYKIHPNTPFYEELKSRGEISDDSWFIPQLGCDTPYGNELYFCKELFPSATLNFAQGRFVVENSGEIFRNINQNHNFLAGVN